MIEEGAEELLALLTTQGEPLVERAADRLTAVVIAGWPLIRRRDAELLGDVLVRLAISYAALPDGEVSATAAGRLEPVRPLRREARAGAGPRWRREQRRPGAGAP